MKAFLGTCIVGAMTLAGIFHQLGGGTPGATVKDAARASTASPAASAVPALQPAAPEASAPPTRALGFKLASAGEVSLPLMAKADIGDDAIATKAVDLVRPDAVPAVPTTPGASDDSASAAPATQDFSWLTYYVWSELPPAEKPADIVLRSLKDIPVGTPIEEIKRAADAFGLDFTFMKAVAKIESGFDPKQRTGSYMGLFQLSKGEFNKFGSGKILDPRDNAVAAAYKMITEGILFEWVTHKHPDLSDLYLIHQQGWEGAAQHINQPDRIAWKSMCATSEGVEKGERWCKRAIWGNTLPAIKRAWKSVDKLTSAAFVGMWRERVAHFESKYMLAAAGAAAPAGRAEAASPPRHEKVAQRPPSKRSKAARVHLTAATTR